MKLEISVSSKNFKEIYDSAHKNEFASLRAMEGILHFKIRGYTGAAKYFARLLRQWISNFEKLFERRLQNPDDTFLPILSERPEMPNPAYLLPTDTATSIAPSSDARWAIMPPNSQPQFPPFNPLQAQPALDPSTTAFSTPLTSLPEADLAIVTSDGNDPHSRYWTPPVHYPDPPSASGINTDFGGNDLFNADYDFRNFEVNDLLLPGWLGADLTATSVLQGRMGNGQGRWN